LSRKTLHNSNNDFNKNKVTVVIAIFSASIIAMAAAIVSLQPETIHFSLFKFQYRIKSYRLLIPTKSRSFNRHLTFADCLSLSHAFDFFKNLC
jgi:hypothetical protein